MSADNSSQSVKFTTVPDVSPLDFRDTAFARYGVSLLALILIGAAFFCTSQIFSALRKQPTIPNAIVAAADLQAYQVIDLSDVVLKEVETPQQGSVLTDTNFITGNVIVVKPIKKEEAITAGAIVTFPAAIDLNGTVILSLPLSGADLLTSTLKAGQAVLAIGTAISETPLSAVYSTTVPLIELRGTSAIVAVQPEEAANLSLYFPPRGFIVLAPTLEP
jgi:hypothetical protein